MLEKAKQMNNIIEQTPYFYCSNPVNINNITPLFHIHAGN